MPILDCKAIETPMKATIRKAGLEDLQILRSFEQGLIRDERPFDPTIRPDPVHYYDLESLLSDSDSYVVVAEYKGEIVASGYATKATPRPYLDHQSYAYLGFMYTRPEYRGLGINALVIQAMKDWSKEKGLHEMRLTVYSGNQPALRAYQKTGFKSHMVEMRYKHPE